jgi:hypothetical protein
MVYAVQAFLKFGSTSARDQVKDDAETFTAEKWGIERIESVEWEGDPSLVIELRFESKVNQNALTNRLDQFLSGPLEPLSGSFVNWHDCPHDESTKSCVPDDGVTW